MTIKCTAYLKGCRCPKCEARTKADPAYQQHLVLVRALNNPAPQNISDAFARHDGYERQRFALSGST